MARKFSRVTFLTNLKSEDQEFSFVWRKKKLECLGMAPFAVHHLKLHESDWRSESDDQRVTQSLRYLFHVFQSETHLCIPWSLVLIAIWANNFAELNSWSDESDYRPHACVIPLIITAPWKESKKGQTPTACEFRPPYFGRATIFRRISIKFALSQRWPLSPDLWCFTSQWGRGHEEARGNW